MTRSLLICFFLVGLSLCAGGQPIPDSSKDAAMHPGETTVADSAQAESIVIAPGAVNPPPANADGFQLTNNVFIVLVIFMILLFSFAIIKSLLNPRNGDPLEATELIRVVSMILIVTCALLVPVIAGQINSIPTVAAPLYSLLGTIAGYLLGKSSLGSSGSTNSGSNNPPSGSNP